jgi:hypothetical protein
VKVPGRFGALNCNVTVDVPGGKSPTLIMFAFTVSVLDITVNDWNNVLVWITAFL